MTMSAGADWREEIGFARLQGIAGSELPTVPSQGLGQVEASISTTSTVCIPNTNSAEFTGKTFVLKGGATGTSWHADKVATNFYGSSSILSGTCGIDLWLADNWLNSDFLASGSFSPPLVESRAVQNHSWIGSNSNSQELSRRLDFAVERDGFVCVVGTNNSASTVLPQLLCQTYNTISVGRDDGDHSAGLTTIDGLGRMKPDIVAPSTAPENATSWTTPMVAGAAGLLHAKLSAVPYSLTGADRPRVVKALLLASATKNTVPGWDNSSTSPLDMVYGAGELNLYHAYSTLRSGRASASNPILHNLRGWAAESVSQSSQKTYFFTIPAGAPSTPFCAALTWHRIVADTINGNSLWGNLSSTLANLKISLYQASGFSVGGLISTSNSSVDNVELIYQSALVPGNYAIRVESQSTSSTPYALAWHSLPSVTLAADIPTAKEIDGQAGLITLTRTGDTTLPLFVPLTLGGNAVSGTHYQPFPSNVTIAAGQVSASLPLIPIPDSLAQGSRDVIVAIAADFTSVRDAAQTAVVTIQDKPFDAWRFANFTQSELAAPEISNETADPDGDHLANLVEYALALPPKSPTPSPVAMTDQNGYLALAVAKNPSASDITWEAQVTGDLSNWTPAITTSNTLNDFTARDGVLKTAANQRFIRLKITRP
jgi:Subtilase family